MSLKMTIEEVLPMEQIVTERFITVNERARQDSDYQQLLAEYRVRERQLMEALETMNENQRDAVLDYLGLAGEMHRKLLELACKL